MTNDSKSPAKIRNIADLAKIAGVTPGTVSRALSDKGMISASTRERIKALAAKHNFRPNVMARNLRIQRTGAVQVVIPLGHEKGQHLSDPFFMTMLGHLADGLTEQGYELILSKVVPEDDQWLDKIIAAGRADGVIIVGQSDQAATLDRASDDYSPLIAWGGFYEGQRHCSVGSDNYRGGEIAAKHLISQGCTKIAYLGDPTALEISLRLNGCRMAVKNAGLKEPLAHMPAHLADGSSASDIIEFWTSQKTKPDGIVAASDIIAVNAILALAGLGVVAPRDVRIVGYDDLPIAQQTSPQLTTVRQDFAAGARELIRLLFARMNGEEAAGVVMEPELIIRQSA